MSARIAVIGCGTVARRYHLPGFRAAGAEVVAFASASRASAEAAMSEWGGGRIVEDWREALRLEDVTAVDIATPNVLHAEIAIAAARAGKHILVEKPIATSLAEADAMIAAAAESGVRLVVAHNARFSALARAALAARARIGAVRSMRLVLRTEGPATWAPGAEWFTDPARSGGGALLDIGVHLADLVRLLSGQEAIEAAAVTRPEVPQEVDALAALTLDGGGIALIHAGWDASPGTDVSLVIAGEEGTFTVGERSAPVVLRPGADPEPVDPGPEQDAYAVFARALAGEIAVPVPGEDGRAALAIVLAAAEAARTGTRAKVVR